MVRFPVGVEMAASKDVRCSFIGNEEYFFTEGRAKNSAEEFSNAKDVSVRV